MACRRFLKITNDSSDTVVIGGAPEVGGLGISSNASKIVDLFALSLKDLQGLNAFIVAGTVSVAQPAAADYSAESLGDLDEHLDSAVS